MLYKAKSILDESVRHSEDTEVIGRFLNDKALSLTSLSLYEVSSLWECYSEESCAQFLTVDEKSLSNFWYWLSNRQQ